MDRRRRPGRVGFVQDGELRLQQQKLEHLDLLFLAAREAHAQLAVEVGGVHVELCRELLDAPAELLALHLQAGAAGDAGTQKARQRHARDLDRGLEAQEQPARERLSVVSSVMSWPSKTMRPSLTV